MSDFEFDTPVAVKKRGAPSFTPTTTPQEATEPTQESPDTAGALDKPKADKPKYDPEELLTIFDEIMFSGEYSEQVTIRGKLKVTFRTRTAEEVRNINRMVDGTPATFASTLEGVRSLLELRYALVMYQGKDLRSIKDDERDRFLNSLPAPVVGTLLKALSNFDAKVYEACQEGEANF